MNDHIDVLPKLSLIDSVMHRLAHAMTPRFYYRSERVSRLFIVMARSKEFTIGISNLSRYERAIFDCGVVDFYLPRYLSLYGLYGIYYHPRGELRWQDEMPNVYAAWLIKRRIKAHRENNHVD